jgi:hypothetical protein
VTFYRRICDLRPIIVSSVANKQTLKRLLCGGDDSDNCNVKRMSDRSGRGNREIFSKSGKIFNGNDGQSVERSTVFYNSFIHIS